MSRKRIRAVAIFVRSHGRYAAIMHSERDGIEIPAGHIERGETTRDAAFRELKEETGLKVHKLTRLGELPGDTGIVAFFAKATGEMRSSSEGYAFWATKQDLLGPMATFAKSNAVGFEKIKRMK